MTISIQDGAIVIEQGSRTVFDTDDKLFHVIDPLNGSTPSLAYLTQPHVGQDIDNYLVLGSVNPICTQVIGAVRMRLTGGSYNAGLMFDRWHTVMGGTIVWVLDGEPGASSVKGSNLGCRQAVLYWFEVVGGQVRLRRRAAFDGTPLQYGVRAHVLDYKLKCGVWV